MKPLNTLSQMIFPRTAQPALLRQVILTASLLTTTGIMTAAQAKTVPKVPTGSGAQANKAVYMDTHEHEWYTAAQAGRLHFKSDTGHPLVKVRFVPVGAKPTDDKIPPPNRVAANR